MANKISLTIKKHSTMTYTIKSGDKVIWQGQDVHKVFPVIQSEHKGKKLSVAWDTAKGSVNV
jgi:hypothetical protein